MNDVLTNSKELGHYVGGRIVPGSGKTHSIENPALGRTIKTARLATAEDVDRAVRTAKETFPAWSSTPPAKRGRIMAKFMDLILKHMDDLARLVSEEHGKTLEDAKGSVTRGLEVVEFCTGVTHHLRSDFTSEVSSGIDSHNMRMPLGVCAGITPFNFPAMVPMWMFPVALACGNTFVLKPSEKNPSCSLRLAELMVEAGLPEGALNVLIGDKTAVDAILDHKDIESVSFVGSTAVGEYVYRRGCAANKRVQALCGAKNHLLVMPDVDLDKATDALVGSAYGSAGERCMAVSVAVAVGGIADALVGKLAERALALKVGPYHEKGVEMGPVITSESLDRIRSYVERGVEEGAELVVDGRGLKVPGFEKGHFIGGCLFDRVRPDMSIYRDEIFGPVLSVVRVESYEEGLKLVNDHEYGNGASVFTRDGAVARHFGMHAKAGMIGVNVPIPVPVAYHSFGGWKRSIFGGNGVHGMEGIRFYTKLKTVTTRWFSDGGPGAQFHFKSGSEQ